MAGEEGSTRERRVVTREIEGKEKETYHSECLPELLLGPPESDGVDVRVGGRYLHPHPSGLEHLLETLAAWTYDVLVLGLLHLNRHSSIRTTLQVHNNTCEKVHMGRRCHNSYNSCTFRQCLWLAIYLQKYTPQNLGGESKLALWGASNLYP